MRDLIAQIPERYKFYKQEHRDMLAEVGDKLLADQAFAKLYAALKPKVSHVGAGWRGDEIVTDMVAMHLIDQEGNDPVTVDGILKAHGFMPDEEEEGFSEGVTTYRHPDNNIKLRLNWFQGSITCRL